MRRIAAAALALTLLAPAATANAGPPGTWTQVTPVGAPISNILRVGLARTPDGVLHVGWSQSPGTTGAVYSSTVSADAKTIGGPAPIFANAAGGVNESVALVAVPGGGLRAFFAGTNAFDDALGTAVSADGATWTGVATASQGGNAAKPVYTASGIGAGVGKDGVFYAAWGDSAPGGAGMHVGLDANVPDLPLGGSALKSDPGVGVDAASGAVYVAWNEIDLDGVTFMPIGGAPVTIPGSVGQVQNRVGITGRLGAPGVFVAYTQGSNEFLAKPAVYRIDTGKARRLSNAKAEDMSISPAPGGRLWAMWKKDSRLYATRSNPDVSKWGPIVTLRAPKGASTVSDVAGDGTLGPLDLVVLADQASWHQRVLPALSLVKVKGGFKVTDAGEPVAGAKVKVKGVKQGKTASAKGVVKIKLGKGKHRASASKSGYASAKLTFRSK